MVPLVRWPGRIRARARGRGGRIRARDRDRGGRIRVRVKVRLRAGVRVRVGARATSDHAELVVCSLRPPDAPEPHVQEALEP